jgi:hypothetical protein
MDARGGQRGSDIRDECPTIQIIGNFSNAEDLPDELWSALSRLCGGGVVVSADPASNGSNDVSMCVFETMDYGRGTGGFPLSERVCQFPNPSSLIHSFKSEIRNSWFRVMNNSGYHASGVA